MKTIAASTFGLALLLIVSFVSLKVSEASVGSSSQTAQPAPPPDKSKGNFAAPTPRCSPHPTPLSESEKNNPLREMNLEEYVNLSLGTPDFDCDGVCNFRDNCQSVYNPDQKDGNADGIGDACDPKLVDPSFIDSRCDMDGDGIPDIRDNCPSACNPNQKFVDINENKVNDLCDSSLPNFAFDTPCVRRKKVKEPRPPAPKKISAVSPSPAPLSEYPLQELTIDLGLGTNDWDCDGIPNIKDNCIFVYNPNQKDRNGDGKSNACDPKLVDPSFKDSRCDQDKDGIPDFIDNCLLACNPDQKDANKNGIGDVCDQAFPNAVLALQVCEKPRKVKAPSNGFSG
jgi:hypothetical protein